MVQSLVVNHRSNCIRSVQGTKGLRPTAGDGCSHGGESWRWLSVSRPPSGLTMDERERERSPASLRTIDVRPTPPSHSQPATKQGPQPRGSPMPSESHMHNEPGTLPQEDAPDSKDQASPPPTVGVVEQGTADLWSSRDPANVLPQRRHQEAVVIWPGSQTHRPGAFRCRQVSPTLSATRNPAQAHTLQEARRQHDGLDILGLSAVPFQ